MRRVRGAGEAGREAKSARTSLPPMRNPGNKAGSTRARDSGIGDCPRFHRLSLLLWCKLRPLLYLIFGLESNIFSIFQSWGDFIFSPSTS